ncbi:FAD binding domain-containing protein [Paracidovorax cattleyae]|uniref:Xanthine dehydrogenase YagS FAD-binding subunit n=2 Tax=Paracidovorax cattleyae TaxID=80868 RepID=A0A1H0W984_9BURK|nr:xanthine dehydrogenase family protein subunit M [Paracidovorax cattleyae]AVS75561.1 xanthine dehydrogenase family protein subunit M [Paracidovorax cattleyae]SDP87041.1 xanthine dehydrogenase YagS FAD-binding subunit [Paracidovorax cattleyae]
MRGFDYVVALDDEMALATMPQGMHHASERAPPAKFIAGGTNLIDLMKESVMRPSRLVDVGRLPFAGIEEAEDGGVRLGALARNAATAHHPLVRERYPMLAAAILAGASPQIRNMATNGGNLLQRTRCHYFYDVAVPCNKREPGTGCPARNGLARQLAILGTSDHCIATHPSDMCVALAALETLVHVRSPRGERTIAFSDFHRLPGSEPDRDTVLAGDELITHIALPAQGFAQHGAYLKVRDRASYAFALVSVAAGLDVGEDGRIRTARIAVGGVAPKPWRVPEAEEVLAGCAPTAQAFARAAGRLLQGARGHGAPGGPGDNRFKIELARRAIVRALEMARDGELTNTGELGAGHDQGAQP